MEGYVRQLSPDHATFFGEMIHQLQSKFDPVIQREGEGSMELVLALQGIPIYLPYPRADTVITTYAEAKRIHREGRDTYNHVTSLYNLWKLRGVQLQEMIRDIKFVSLDTDEYNALCYTTQELIIAQGHNTNVKKYMTSRIMLIWYFHQITVVLFNYRQTLPHRHLSENPVLAMQYRETHGQCYLSGATSTRYVKKYTELFLQERQTVYTMFSNQNPDSLVSLLLNYLEDRHPASDFRADMRNYLLKATHFKYNYLLAECIDMVEYSSGEDDEVLI